VIGQTVIARGWVLNPSRIGALAALGVADVEVYAKPTIAILSTGNEIADPGQELQTGTDLRHQQIHVEHHHPGTRRGALTVRNRARHDRGARARHRRVRIVRRARLLGRQFRWRARFDPRRDQKQGRDRLSRNSSEARQANRVRHDQRQADVRYAWIPDILPLERLHMLLVPALRSMARLAPRHTQTLSLPVGQRIVSTTGRHQFYTVSGRRPGDASVQASGDITSMSQADGYIEIPAQTDIVEKGESSTSSCSDGQAIARRSFSRIQPAAMR
jgi:hypothetical protein